tara:strand:+ start:1466 stop:1804 length:339 start_codon:yes stop_codon:yes gene_type:complete
MDIDYAINIFNKILRKKVTYRGETFRGYNKPKRTPNHPTKSHSVLARVRDKKGGYVVRLIRFGQQGVKGEGDPAKSDTKADKARRKAFKARHKENIKRGKMSAAYWSDLVKW